MQRFPAAQRKVAREANKEHYGISLLQLMETAGRNVADEIAARFNSKKTRVAIFCGSGGKGGDGFKVQNEYINQTLSKKR